MDKQITTPQISTPQSSTVQLAPAVKTLVEIIRTQIETGKERAYNSDGAGEKTHLLECWQTYKTASITELRARGLWNICCRPAFARAKLISQFVIRQRSFL